MLGSKKITNMTNESNDDYYNEVSPIKVGGKLSDYSIADEESDDQELTLIKVKNEGPATGIKKDVKKIKYLGIYYEEEMANLLKKLDGEQQYENDNVKRKFWMDRANELNTLYNKRIAKEISKFPKTEEGKEDAEEKKEELEEYYEEIVEE